MAPSVKVPRCQCSDFFGPRQCILPEGHDDICTIDTEKAKAAGVEFILSAKVLIVNVKIFCETEK